MSRDLRQVAMEAEAALASLLVVASNLWPDEDRALRAALAIAQKLAR